MALFQRGRIRLEAAEAGDVAVERVVIFDDFVCGVVHGGFDVFRQHDRAPRFMSTARSRHRAKREDAPSSFSAGASQYPSAG